MNKTKSVVMLIIITVLILFLAVFSFWPTKIKMGVRDYSSPVNQFALSIDLADSNNVTFKIAEDATREDLEATVAVLENRLKLIQDKLNVSGVEAADISIGNGVMTVRLPKDPNVSVGTILLCWVRRVNYLLLTVRKRIAQLQSPLWTLKQKKN